MTLQTTYTQKKEQDYYSILEITQEATKSEIRSSRRKLLSKYHPDKHEPKDKDLAIKISSLINEAFEALTDEDFRERYNKSGFSIDHSVSDSPTSFRRAKEVKDVKGKGLSLTSVVYVDKETLKNGGEVEAKPVQVQGMDIDLSPRKIKISPLTVSNTFLVYSGLGEQKENGHNGDLLVMIVHKARLTGTDDVLFNIKPSVPLITLKDIKKGEHEVEINDFKVSLNKKNKNDSLLFIKDVSELNSPLLIKY